jgi:hypothetical protein
MSDAAQVLERELMAWRIRRRADAVTCSAWRAAA